MPPRGLILLFHPPGITTSCKPHMHDDMMMFSGSNRITTLLKSLVGDFGPTQCIACTCTLLVSVGALVHCCLCARLFANNPASEIKYFTGRAISPSLPLPNLDLPLANHPPQGLSCLQLVAAVLFLGKRCRCERFRARFQASLSSIADRQSRQLEGLRTTADDVP